MIPQSQVSKLSNRLLKEQGGRRITVKDKRMNEPLPIKKINKILAMNAQTTFIYEIYSKKSEKSWTSHNVNKALTLCPKGCSGKFRTFLQRIPCSMIRFL
jgi:hypothetical protein